MDDLRVLIIDDEPDMREGVSRVLSRFRVRIPETDAEVGFIAVQAADGAQAAAHREAQGFDLFLVDYKLPDITGLEILDTIKQAGTDALAVMVTAYASLDVAVSATKNGAFDFLAKPFTTDELKSVVGKAARALLLGRQARRLAEEKRRLRFQFISVLTHELKAPLAAVEGYIRIMQEGVLGEERSKYLPSIDRSLIRIEGMRKLIYDLLDLTRIESGQKKRELGQLDVAECARDCLETVRPQADENRISLMLESPDRCLLFADRGEIDIILNNLISNAVKYNREGGSVVCTLAPQETGITIKVSDTGIGMSAEEQGRLFEEFVRIRNEKTKNILGSGLGLSILKKLTGLYGGSITVESVPDKGTTFTLTLHNARPESAS